mmetsp:Transcript_3696/g.7296  ORF Transcript_3696/g.7296 Transcript_3696/m.7296 type:complete len:340 (-) Transcript_3696:339-1358(-)
MAVRVVQGRPAPPIAPVDFGSLRHEEFDHVQVALGTRHVEGGAAVVVPEVDVVEVGAEVGLDGGEVADGAELEEGAARGELAGVGGEVVVRGEDAVAAAAVEGAVEVEGGAGGGGGFGLFVARVGVGVGEGVGEGAAPGGEFGEGGGHVGVGVGRWRVGSGLVARLEFEGERGGGTRRMGWRSWRGRVGRHAGHGHRDFESGRVRKGNRSLTLFWQGRIISCAVPSAVIPMSVFRKRHLHVISMIGSHMQIDAHGPHAADAAATVARRKRNLRIDFHQRPPRRGGTGGRVRGPAPAAMIPTRTGRIPLQNVVQRIVPVFVPRHHAGIHRVEGAVAVGIQ